MATLQEVKNVQPEWFSPENKRFFGDINYKVLHGEISKKPFLVRSTYAWTDMFGEKRTLHYRVNEIESNLKIGSLIETSFTSMDEVKEWLKEN